MIQLADVAARQLRHGIELELLDVARGLGQPLDRARHAPTEPKGSGDRGNEAAEAQEKGMPEPPDLGTGYAGRQVGADDPGLVPEAGDLAIEHDPLAPLGGCQAGRAAHAPIDDLDDLGRAHPHGGQYGVADLGQQRQRAVGADD